MSLGASSLTAADQNNVPPWDVFSTPSRNSGGNHLTGVIALSADDAWAVGPGHSYFAIQTTLTEHWDGTTWTIVSSPNPTGSTSSWLTDVDGASSNDVWAVGGFKNGSGSTATLIEHWNGTAWSIVDSPTSGTSSQLRDVAAISANDAWAVGESGSGSIILRWNGARWSAVANPCSFNLHAVSAVAADDIWAVGYQHSCHWDGHAWTKVSVDPYNQTTLLDVAAAAPDSVWAVSRRTICPYDCWTTSVIWQWNGTTWRSGFITDDALTGVEVTPSGRVYVVGTRIGTSALILVRDGFSWKTAPNPIIRGSLSAVSSSPAEDLWAVGQTTNTTPPQTFAERAPAPASGGVIGGTGNSSATVSWFGAERGSIPTDSSGEYAIGGLQPGDYTLIATVPYCEPAMVTVTVSAGVTFSQDLPVVC